MARKARQPWLAERGGVYYVFWYDKQAGRVKRLSTRERDATKARVAFATFLAEGVCSPDADHKGELTCGMVLDAYWNEHVKNNTVDSARHKIRMDYLHQHFGPVPIREANDPVSLPDGRTVSRLEHYCLRRASNDIRGKHKARTSTGPTHRLELSYLVSAVNHAIRTKRLLSDQAPYLPLPDASPPRDRWLDKAELARLFEAAKAPVAGEDTDRMSRRYRFVLLCYFTAGRRASIEQLTWFQVDTKNWNKISLDKPGAKKTKKRRPTVPISAALLPHLKQMYAERVSEYVLDHPRPVYHDFRAAVTAAGLDGVTPHTLRHTRATHLLQQGVSVWQVAGLLGDTIVTVSRVYGHHCPDHLNEVMEADLKGMV